jgi:hypothetical protein
MGDFSIHMTLMYPFLIVLAGAGIALVIESVSKKYSILAILLLLTIYVANISGFWVTYFHQYPLKGDADFPMRVLTKYIQFVKQKDQQITVYASSPNDLFQKYIYYSNSITKEHIPTIASQLFKEDIMFGKLTLLQCDGKESTGAGTLSIYDHGCDKKVQGKHTAITRLIDGGETYTIVGDQVCSPYTLKPYAQNIQISDFAIERMEEKQFCETYVSIRE